MAEQATDTTIQGPPPTTTTQKTPETKTDTKDIKGDVTLSIRGVPEFDRFPFKRAKEKFLFMASIKAPLFKNNDRVPIDLVCVIDESSSMTGSRIELVKKTVGFIIENLENHDRFGCVGYSNSSRIIMPLIKCNSIGRKKALDAVYKIHAKGCTALCAGLCEGINMLRRRNKNELNSVASVMLFTDGEANEGPKTAGAIIDAMMDPKWNVKSKIDHIQSNNNHYYNQQQRRIPLAAAGLGLAQNYYGNTNNNNNNNNNYNPYAQGRNAQSPYGQRQYVASPQQQYYNNTASHYSTMQYPTQSSRNTRMPPPIPQYQSNPMAQGMNNNNNNNQAKYSLNMNQMPLPVNPQPRRMNNNNNNNNTSMMNGPTFQPGAQRRNMQGARNSVNNKWAKKNNDIINNDSVLDEKEGQSMDGEEDPQRALPCTINTFGFGADHKCSVLEAIAEAGRGMYSFIENTDMIAETFAEALGGLISVIGKDLKVRIEALNNVEIVKCLNTKGFQITKEIEYKKWCIFVPDIQSEESREFLFEINLPAVSMKNDKSPMMQLSVEYHNVILDEKKILSNICCIDRTEGMEISGEKNMDLDMQYNRIIAADAMKKANELAAKKQMEKARLVMRNAQRQIHTSPSSHMDFCQNLSLDLTNNSASALSSYAQYSSVGQQQLAMNCNVHYQQRGTNSNRNAMHAMYSNNNNNKSNMMNNFK